MPLDPNRLTPSASLNRVQIVALPGVDLDPAFQGKRGAELLSQAAIAAMVRGRAAELGLTPLVGAADSLLVAAFERCLAGQGPAAGAADAVAAQIGRRLAAFLATLRRGDPPNRAARPDWDASDWEHWGRVRRVWLGGGMAAGALGAALVRSASAELPGLGVADLELRLEPAWASALPLIGAARSLPPDAGGGLACDFGHTSVKVGYARIAGGELTRLTLLPRRPVPFDPGPPPAELRETRAGELARFMGELIGAVWSGLRAQGLPLARVIRVSVASYIDEQSNHPLLPVSGLYALAGTVAPSLGAYLGALVSDALGEPIAVRLAHDGTSAARCFAGVSDAAVIMLGTALGVGFPPPSAAQLLPLGRAFAVDAPQPAA